MNYFNTNLRPNIQVVIGNKVLILSKLSYFPVMLRKNNIGLVTLEEKNQSPQALLQLTILAKLLLMKIKREISKYLCRQIFELPETLYFYALC